MPLLLFKNVIQCSKCYLMYQVNLNILSALFLSLQTASTDWPHSFTYSNPFCTQIKPKLPVTDIKRGTQMDYMYL
ncbi:hypothetical protein HanXRQr2_Chr09g0397041 [Helianthus annuus]|uniref:Uncharacterized protein n=1 Tax=Helianthus annuus TaxID=4232 RepID=A0A251S3C4_HELAN|nr:hypothetical protein HanXRQr2_Chr09g0397041 [Helianthus annuus]KAJ0893881.1 hypothetical protein HanPSC8_Chr09g0382801 [Helianthus annuus]